MRNNMIVTTTNSIENAEIEKYIDLISTNVVIGTNFFSDLGASFTDLFGGYSDTYQNKLQKIYSSAIDNLKQKASNIGANAILGLKIDFDEISGKGKSMFMISAIGTAVIVKHLKSNVFPSTLNNPLTIPNDRLEIEVSRRYIISRLKKEVLPAKEDWIYLFNNPIEDIAESLIIEYLKYYSNTEFQTQAVIELLANTPKYFKIISYENAVRVIYPHIKDNPKAILDIIKENKLLSPENILDLIKENEFSLAIECSLSEKEYYSPDNLNILQQILDQLENIPKHGRIELVKSLLGKPKEKYICPNGHSNDSEVEFCGEYNCGKNINGLTRIDTIKIKTLSLRIESLKAIFNEEGL
jgi:uncharacterized protein YbjQ (UPF0145 family)